MNKYLFTFLEFLLGGIILGIFEDFILVTLLTDEPITLSMLLIIFLVTLPFAVFGEFVVDKVDFLKIFRLNRKYKNWEFFFEFLIFGVLLGVCEDLIAFHFSVSYEIDFFVVLTSLFVAIPFAFISEIIFDKFN
jgi:hypothetical protein